MKVYIVMFTTGETYDFVSIQDRIFHTEEKAKEYIDEKNGQLKEDKLHFDCNESARNYVFDYEYYLDKYGYTIDYTGARYIMQGPFEVF